VNFGLCHPEGWGRAALGAHCSYFFLAGLADVVAHSISTSMRVS
jgi:hypothetical protein